VAVTFVMDDKQPIERFICGSQSGIKDVGY
jgi:hypothetical protein